MDHDIVNKLARDLRVASQLMECEQLDSDARSFIQHTALDAAEIIEGEDELNSN